MSARFTHLGRGRVSGVFGVRSGLRPGRLVTVDGWDVEAVLAAAACAACRARARDSATLLSMPMHVRRTRPDPISVLMIRMRQDRQADDNALDAIAAAAGSACDPPVAQDTA